MPVPYLNSDDLIRTATEISGLSHFGDDAFRVPLDKFIASCANDGFVTEAGFAVIQETILNILLNRLHFEDDLRKHPEILNEKIVAPLIIIGAGRVGSTKLHRLLGNASNIQTLPFWQLKNPARPAVPGPDGKDPRIAGMEQVCFHMETAMPQLFAAVEPIAAAPDEDVHLLDLTFMQFYFSAVAYAPDYLSWIFKQDWRGPYQYFKKLLQYLQWQNQTAGKPMLLKGPFHTAYIDILAELFPDAKFIQIHRDPVTCAASLGKVACLWQQLSQGKGSLPQYGELLEDYIAHAFLENLKIRDRHPELHVADFYYEQVVGDAVGLAQKIFDFWGVELTASDKARMLAWEQHHSQHKLGKFNYTVEEMGVNRARMETKLRPYMQKFYADACTT